MIPPDGWMIGGSCFIAITFYFFFFFFWQAGVYNLIQYGMIDSPDVFNSDSRR